MIGHVKAANAVLLQNFAKGFSLGATHHPHVSIFMAFVPTSDLQKVYAASGEVLTKEDYTSWKLTAFKYICIPQGQIGLAGIAAEPTPDLRRTTGPALWSQARPVYQSAVVLDFGQCGPIVGGDVQSITARWMSGSWPG